MNIAALMIATTLGPAPDARIEPLPLKLQMISETRVVDVRQTEDRPMFGSGPGLDIAFEAGLPKGSKVLEVTQPEKVDAKDSAGTDLAGIDGNVFDVREYLKIDDWFDEASVLHVRLGLTARKAETFSVHLEAQATVYTGVEPHDVATVEEWTKFTHPSLSAVKAEYRYRKPEDAGGALQIRPPSARDLIESIVPAAEGAEPAGYSISYSDELASFDVDPLEPGQKLRVFVRKDIQKLPIVVDLKDQKLP